MIWTNIRRGVLVGTVIGMLLSLLVLLNLTLLAYVVDDHQASAPTPLLTIGAVYVVGGVIGGAIAGALANWARNGLLAGIIGVLAFLPIIAVISVFEGDGQGLGDVRGIVVVSTVLGFPLGVIGRGLIRRVDPFGPIP